MRAHDGSSTPGSDARRRSPGRDDVLAKKRARLALIERLDRHGRGAGRPAESREVSAIRLLAEVDLALSEHRRTERV